MSAGKADALHTLLERLLDATPDYDNFFRQHCFPLNSRYGTSHTWYPPPPTKGAHHTTIEPRHLAK